MCTTASGTATWRIADGIEKYISSKGYTCITATETQDPASLLTSKIRAERPVIINMTKHYYYGNHSALVVGYVRYKYSNSSSTYYRIADGISGGCNRYVHSSIGMNGDFTITTVKLK